MKIFVKEVREILTKDTWVNRCPDFYAKNNECCLLSAFGQIWEENFSGWGEEREKAHDEFYKRFYKITGNPFVAAWNDSRKSFNDIEEILDKLEQDEV